MLKRIKTKVALFVTVHKVLIFVRTFSIDCLTEFWSKYQIDQFLWKWNSVSSNSCLKTLFKYLSHPRSNNIIQLTVPWVILYDESRYEHVASFELEKVTLLDLKNPICGFRHVKMVATKSYSKLNSKVTKTFRNFYINLFTWTGLKRWKVVVWLGLGRVELVTFRLLLFHHILE